MRTLVAAVVIMVLAFLGSELAEKVDIPGLSGSNLTGCPPTSAKEAARAIGGAEKNWRKTEKGFTYTGTTPIRFTVRKDCTVVLPTGTAKAGEQITIEKGVTIRTN